MNILKMFSQSNLCKSFFSYNTNFILIIKSLSVYIYLRDIRFFFFFVI